jgi:hypothetical protein
MTAPCCALAVCHRRSVRLETSDHWRWQDQGEHGAGDDIVGRSGYQDLHREAPTAMASVNECIPSRRRRRQRLSGGTSHGQGVGAEPPSGRRRRCSARLRRWPSYRHRECGRRGAELDATWAPWTSTSRYGMVLGREARHLLPLGSVQCSVFRPTAVSGIRAGCTSAGMPATHQINTYGDLSAWPEYFELFNGTVIW